MGRARLLRNLRSGLALDDGLGLGLGSGMSVKSQFSKAMAFRAVLSLTVSLVVLLLVACGDPPPVEPVAAVEIQLSSEDLPYPEWRTLRLSWQPLENFEKEAPQRVFLHLLDSEGELLRTFDHPLPQAWRAGEAVSYEVQLYQSALARPLPAGDYRLTLGLYQVDGPRFPLRVSGRDLCDYEYEVASLSVPPVDASAPSFSFPPPWLPPQEGTDAQILSRRRLSAEGSLLIQNLEVPGSLRLHIVVPPVDGKSRSLRLDDDQERATLEISSTCTGTVRSLEVPGNHDLVLPVFPTGAATQCEITLAPNYHLIDLHSGETWVAALEMIAWAAAEL